MHTLFSVGLDGAPTCGVTMQKLFRGLVFPPVGIDVGTGSGTCKVGCVEIGLEEEAPYVHVTLTAIDVGDDANFDLVKRALEYCGWQTSGQMQETIKGLPSE